MLRLRFTCKNGYLQQRLSSFVKHECDPNLIRNIGIIAHIDAGKTTITERLLYLTGRTKTVGNVDDGNTVTDFMQIERDRGITIQSAAVASFYKGHRINLIDTPGHVDFTIEVRRSLRILDGAVTLLDGSAGVQAQTLTVWKQVMKNQLPTVFFVNKMDKSNADFKMSLNSIQDKLQLPGVPLVVPILNDKKVEGFLNLIEGNYLMLNDSKWIDVKRNSAINDLLLAGQQDMFGKIAEFDDDFANIFLESETCAQIHIRDAITALKRATLTRKVSPVVCGSGLKNIKSVIPLLELIVNFLPSPLEKKCEIPEEIHTCGMIFKVTHDKRLGQLSYVRMYKGLLNSSKPIVINNITYGAQLLQSSIKLFVPFSDELEPVDHVDAHNIAVISGLNQAVTGDTLLDASIYSKKTKDYFHFDGIEVPEPVFYCSIEPPNVGANMRLERALAEIVVEDPSFRIRQDAELGQTIVETMGELHAEVLKYRLKNDYKLDVFMGPLQIGYREMIGNAAEHTGSVQDKFDNQRSQSCSLKLRVEPSSNEANNFKSVIVDLEDEENLTVRADWIKAVNDGCKNALLNGPILGYSVQGVIVKLLSIKTSGGRINLSLLSACASTTLAEALHKSNAYLIEPVMAVEVEVFDFGQSETVQISAILQELNRRQAVISSAQNKDLLEHTKKINATMPLSETTDIASAIRKASSGLASLHMDLAGYQRVPPERQFVIAQHKF